jgi:hypothetical protein
MAKKEAKRGRPPKDRVARVLRTYLDKSLQEGLKEYAREVAS